MLVFDVHTPHMGAACGLHIHAHAAAIHQRPAAIQPRPLADQAQPPLLPARQTNDGTPRRAA